MSGQEKQEHGHQEELVDKAYIKILDLEVDKAYIEFYVEYIEFTQMKIC